ncbi:hypothetical protein HPP92_002072 [Vanilla planifolia]|uniref:Uncharacterized protein n=1 Tax=Vanilla planifolia TaxID=51239 RepID=A0A835VM06_VANPL|nr:hypothetical protein HPP92_002072 [Vanilla planifolia]
MRGKTGVAGSNSVGGVAPPDLLLCFPSRAQLALMPRAISSPSRSINITNRNLNRATSRGRISPLFRSKSIKHSGGTATRDSITEEPTSPTVTCAGQIKVRTGSKPSATSSRDGKGLLSVVEEIERLQKHGKKPLTQFFGALRGMRFDLRCFGSFHGAVNCSTDEEEEAEEEEEDDDENIKGSSSKTLLSKWFMLLEDKQSRGLNSDGERREEEEKEEEEEEEEEKLSPPPNALLLMRCRSAPAKGEERAASEMTEEKEDSLLVMSYAPDFVKVSTEIAKETWVVGNLDPLTRSRSWKR